MQSIPLAVLKRPIDGHLDRNIPYCMQSIPLAVLQHKKQPRVLRGCFFVLQTIDLIKAFGFMDFSVGKWYTDRVRHFDAKMAHRLPARRFVRAIMDCILG